MTETPVSQWAISEVRKWLVKHGFKEYCKDVCDVHKVDGHVLLSLNEHDVRDMIGSGCLGDVKRLTFAIKDLQFQEASSSSHHTPCNNSSVNSSFMNSGTFKNRQYQRYDSEGSTLSDETLELNDKNSPLSKRVSKRLEPEYMKLLLSYVYMFFVFLVTAFVMVIVHDRVPDMKKYPPLPDIVLDNLPYIPWAFDMCEVSGVVLVTIWSVTMFFHKHRWVHSGALHYSQIWLLLQNYCCWYAWCMWFMDKMKESFISYGLFPCAFYACANMLDLHWICHCLSVRDIYYSPAAIALIYAK